MTNIDAKEQQEIMSINALVDELAAANRRLAAMFVKRDEARAAMETLENRRRDIARSILMHGGGDKARKAAELERNDAAILLDDVEMIVAEEQAAVHLAQGRLYTRQILQDWSQAIAIGKRRAALLDNVFEQMAALVAACREFTTAGQLIIPIVLRAKRIPPQPDISYRLDDNRVREFLGNDNQRLANLIMDKLPNNFFIYTKGEAHGNSHGEGNARELAFWKSLEIPDTEANSAKEAA
jgi:hypothetical protein